jgi:hypothetical protein
MVTRGGWGQTQASFEGEAPRLLQALIVNEEPIEGAFRQAYATWEQDLYNDSDQTVVLYPVAGFLSRLGPLRLTADAVARPMTDDEVAQCIHAGLIDIVSDRFAPVHAARWCVAGTVTTRRVLFDPAAPDTWQRGLGEYERKTNELASIADDFVRTLRLHKPGGVRIAGRVAMLGNGGLLYGRNPSPVLFPGPYELTAEDRGPVERLWTAMHSQRVRDDSALQAALRRFAFASERPLIEDRIIDLMIAAEAWFVGGEADELSHRLGLNAANFMAQSRPKRATYEFLRRAYRVRSHIVHGAAAKPKDLVLESGEKVDERRFADALDSFMRDALHLAVELVESGLWRGDWLALVLGQPSPAPEAD